MTPKDPKIAELWKARKALLEVVKRYDDAISALQRLCPHESEVDVSYHGSEDLRCPDCGKGEFP